MNIKHYIRSVPYQPFLIALFVGISIYAPNRKFFQVDAMILPMGILFSLIGAALIILKYAQVDLNKSQILISCALILNFTYYTLYEANLGKWLNIASATIIYSLLFVLLIIVVWKITLSQACKLSGMLDIIAVFVVLIGLANIGSSIVSDAKEIGSVDQKQTFEAQFQSYLTEDLKSPVNNRDFYFIILDRYPGAYTLNEEFGFNNSDFIKNLTSMGFIVLNNSNSNYGATCYSIPSMVNMDYHNQVYKDGYDVENNRLWKFFNSQGFKFVFLPSLSGFEATSKNDNADIILNPPLGTINSSSTFFQETMFFERTLLGKIWHSFYNETNGDFGNVQGAVLNAGRTISDPRIIKDYYGYNHVFVRGSDNALYDYYLSAWHPLGGELLSDPYPITNNTSSNIQIIVRGPDNVLLIGLLYVSSDHIVNAVWHALDGSILSNPNAVVNPVNSDLFNVVARGIDNNIYVRSLDTTDFSGSWTQATFLGNATLDPSVAFDSQNRMHVLATMAGGSVYDFVMDSAGKSQITWINLSGVVAVSSPKVVVDSAYPRYLDIFVTGNDGKLWLNKFNTLSLAGQWQSLGGGPSLVDTIAAPGTLGVDYNANPALAVASNGNIYAFVAASVTGNLKYNILSTSGTNKWFDLAIPVTADPGARDDALRNMVPFAIRNTTGDLLVYNEFSAEDLQARILARKNSEIATKKANTHIYYQSFVADTFENLTQVPKIGGRKFVFTHIDGWENLYNECAYPFQSEYLDRIKAVNPIIELTVKRIIEESEPAPVIVILSDHGKHFVENSNTSMLADDTDKFWISFSGYTTNNIEALYLPDGDDEMIYPDMTPVNVWRMILNFYFGTDFPRTDDKVMKI
jgi:hypothetical protein